MPFSINKITTFWAEINRLLWLSASRDAKYEHIARTAIKRNLLNCLHKLKIQRTAVENLPIPSQSTLKALSWINENDSNFSAFYSAFCHINNALIQEGAQSSYFSITFCLNKTLWKKQQQGRHTLVQLNFAFIRAEPALWVQLADYLQNGSQAARNAFEAYAQSEPFQTLVTIYRSHPPQEAHSQNLLSTLFDELNDRFFNAALHKPRLIWSQRRAYRHLGRYNFQHDTIALSPTLKDPKTPRVALEFVLFHEMLHILHGVKHHNGRAHVHTPAFKKDEDRFPNRIEIEKVLSKLQEIHESEEN